MGLEQLFHPTSNTFQRFDGIARLPYAHYAVERLEVSEVSLHHLLSQISVAIDSDPDSLNADNSTSGDGVVLHTVRDRISELTRVVFSLRRVPTVVAREPPPPP